MPSASAGLPKAIVDAVNREVRRAATKPEVRKHFDNVGEQPRLMSPEELTELVGAEVKRWAPVVRSMVVKK